MNSKITGLAKTAAYSSLLAFTLAGGAAFAQDQQANTQQQSQQAASGQSETQGRAETETASAQGESGSAGETAGAESSGETASVSGLTESEVVVEQQEPSVDVQQREPEVVIQQKAPDVQVRMPEPEVAVEQQEPEVRIQEQQPDVAVKTAEPQTEVQQAEGAEVKVLPPEEGGDVAAVEGEQTDEARQQDQQEQETTAMTPPEPASEAETTATTETTDEPQIADEAMTASAEQMVGRDVYTIDGEQVGGVEEVVRGTADQQLYLVVAYGGFLGLGQEQVVVPMDQAEMQEDRVIITAPLGDQGLEQMATYDESQYEPISGDQGPVG